VLAAHPEMKTAQGAHGIPLIIHAQQGGAAAEGVVAYLTALSE
jgi:hypothetical protein